ncbi:TonB-dependent receptor [Sphingomonas sp. CFBP 13733]|uniref:TonB-dependent receptor n=1 Tax=Sphingomonas sp. CFBP 13733 TaxID=2775291 RepID=UPI00177FFF50|nr:TonB-dependent receptor [Sphingomonas sp. CFBP 13733]MBD8641565.1 TonB-dependent receptor [Sphingomonas sp. CFBP 13733]
MTSGANIKTSKWLVISVAASALHPSFALAQTGQNAITDKPVAEAQAEEPGEIVVTATRFETKASKTPIALTAIGETALRSAGVTDPTALGNLVPNLTINRNNGVQITIRGVTSNDGTEKGDPSAAFMLDGIYIARPQVQEVSFFDIARAEVLRGPQGTLFGRNTTAGAINLISNRPNFDGVSGSIDAAYGNYNNAQLTGVVNAPVTDDLALRAAVTYNRRDNFIRGGTNFPLDLSPFKDDVSTRLSALYVFDKGELLIRGDYSHLGGKVMGQGVFVPTLNFYSNFTTQLTDPTYIASQRSTKQLLTINSQTADLAQYAGLARNLERDSQTYGVGAEFKYDLGPVTFNYLGSARGFDRHEGKLFYYVAGLTPWQYDASFRQNSQEIRLATNGEGPLRAQIGAYYFRERGSVDSILYARVVNGARLVPGQVGYVFAFPQRYVLSESKALFGQATYSLLPSLRLTGGVRYTNDEKARTGATVQCRFDINCGAAGDISSPNNARRTYNKVTWKVGADYDLGSRTLLYGLVATGYKAGGFNDGCEAGTGTGCTLPANSLYYEPETLTNYEIGLKTRFWQNRARLNVSAFHYDYSNLQLSQVGPFCAGGALCTQTTNATAAKIDGIELEGNVAVTDRDRLDGSFSWLDARYGSFFPNAAAYPTLNWEGKRLDRSPEFAFTAGYTHSFPVGDGATFDVGARTRYSASYRLAALAINAQFRQPEFTQTDLTATYTAPDRAWYLQAFAKNLENNLQVTVAGAGANGTVQFSDPRTYGVRAGTRF